MAAVLYPHFFLKNSSIVNFFTRIFLSYGLKKISYCQKINFVFGGIISKLSGVREQL